jgi:hypothetical protein
MVIHDVNSKQNCVGGMHTEIFCTSCSIILQTSSKNLSTFNTEEVQSMCDTWNALAGAQLNELSA